MPADEHEANRETARQIELQRPGWMVVWGVYSKQYVAFPLFAAPAGTILTARYPPALAPRMAAVERREIPEGTRQDMAGKRPRISPADRDERLRRYAELRDQGMLRSDAAREVGVSYSGAGAVYERWYLADRRLPPPRSPCQRAGPWFA